MSKILNPIPGNKDAGGVEISVEQAQKIMNDRLEALKTGEAVPEDFVKAHQEEIAIGNKAAAYPTLIIDLPSKGLLYPEDNPLSLGTVEMKYMTAKEEDILTTESYIKKGVVLDKLFQSLIVSKIDYDTMLIGDRDAIMIAARIYGYGEIYESKITTPSGNTQTVTIDLKEIPHKEVDENLFTSHVNAFEFKLRDGTKLDFCLLTNKDNKEIQVNLKKVKRGDFRDTNLTSRLYQMITAVNGNTDKKFIKAFIENDFRAIDSRNFREFINTIQPGIDMSIDVIDEDTGESFRTDIAIGIDFFWLDI